MLTHDPLRFSAGERRYGGSRHRPRRLRHPGHHVYHSRPPPRRAPGSHDQRYLRVRPGELRLQVWRRDRVRDAAAGGVAAPLLSLRVRVGSPGVEVVRHGPLLMRRGGERGDGPRGRHQRPGEPQVPPLRGDGFLLLGDPVAGWVHRAARGASLGDVVQVRGAQGGVRGERSAGADRVLRVRGAGPDAVLHADRGLRVGVGSGDGVVGVQPRV